MLVTIGDRANYAVEYSFADNYPNHMGYGKIWVKNRFIGSSKDLIYLSGYLIGTLCEFKRAAVLDDSLKNLNKEELHEILCSQPEQSGNYRIRGSTFTDDFDIWVYTLEDKTFFLWKILRTDFFEDLNDYPNEVMLEHIPTETLNAVMDQTVASLKLAGIDVKL